MTTLFPTMEIGSLPKMPGREAKLKGNNPNDKDREQLQQVLRLLQDPPELTIIVENFLKVREKKKIIDSDSRLLEALGLDQAYDKEAQRQFLQAVRQGGIMDSNSMFNIKLLEAIGLDQVYDGEAQRKEMYQAVAEEVTGMIPLDRQVSFVTKAGFPNTFVPFIYTEPLSLPTKLHYDEVSFIASDAVKPVKVPITGAYTLGTWSDLGRFPQDLMQQGMKHSQARHQVMEELVYAFADNVINPTLKELASLGVYRLQIDEPNASAFHGQEEILYEATRRSVAGVKGANEGRGGKEVELGMHICFSKDYGTIAGIAKIPEIKFLTLEIANRDTPDHRAYREVIQAFESAGYQGKYCVGVLDVHTDTLESPELIKDRLLYATELVGPQRIEAAPDCGLRSRTLTMAVQKLQRLVKGTMLAREKYKIS